MDAKNAPEPVRQFAAMCGTDAPTYTRDRPGMSAFVLQDGAVYHTYSTYARGLDGLWGAYATSTKEPPYVSPMYHDSGIVRRWRDVQRRCGSRGSPKMAHPAGLVASLLVAD